jgi:hypothetical protein
MQRVAAVDGHFADAERVYLKISFVGNFSAHRERRDDKLSIYRLNFFKHLATILRLACSADCIYVHSIGNALAILPLYLFHKVVTDMHGAVPEEFRSSGKRAAWLRYVPVEWVAVRFSRCVVTVSKAMAEHLRNKYRLPGLRSFNIPIFEDVEVAGASRGERTLPRVIYAGGAQAWQNVDLMLQSMAQAEGLCNFTVLTGDVATFRQKVAELGLRDVEIGSVPKQEVYGYYAGADYGFVLRDDTVVNRVACPTKLVEYLSCGVIPIVIQPRIGDFLENGYSYLTLERFVSGDFPSEQELQEMKANNYRVVASMKSAALLQLQRLTELCRERRSGAHGA